MSGGRRVVTVTEATFDTTVLQAGLPVLVDFWAGWCPPCRWLDPIVEELAAEQAGRLLVAKVDADDNPGLVRRYGTLSLPSLLVFVNGVEKGRIVGARPKRRLLAEVAEFLPGVVTGADQPLRRRRHRTQWDYAHDAERRRSGRWHPPTVLRSTVRHGRSTGTS